jgi:hypothetical protein
MVLTAAPSGGPAPDVLGATLHDLELTCESRPNVLAPCYADLMAAMRSRTAELNQALSAALSKILAEIFVGRTLGVPDLPAELFIRAVTPSLHLGRDRATLRLELTAEVRGVR